MKYPERDVLHEQYNGPSLTVPAAELLQNPNMAAETWPQLADNPEFMRQVSERYEAIRAINGVVEKIPDPTMKLETAVNRGMLDECEVAHFYTSLSTLLSESDNARLLLYLPFEYIPNSTWEPADHELLLAKYQFLSSYKNAWHDLLSFHDVRADFVDGDVLEPHLRTEEPERVVKATHLLPRLFDLGVISRSEVMRLWSDAKDPLLKQNLMDMIIVIDAEKVPNTKPTIAYGANNEVKSSGFDARTTSRRAEWLRQIHREQMIALHAHKLNEVAQGDIISSDDELDYIWLEAVREQVETLALDNTEQAIARYNDYKDELINMWSNDTGRLYDRISKTFRHLYRLGVISRDDDLRELDVDLPTLKGPLSENAPFMSEQLQRANEIASEIQTHPLLSTYVYPVVGVGGSRLKGYGERDSDFDSCVFIKPDTPIELKTDIREALSQVMRDVGEPEQPAEFWLAQQGEQLVVRSVEQDEHMASEYWTHLLFGNIFIGDTWAVQTLHTDLLSSYFSNDEIDEYDRPKRELFLERIEQSLLQYRLLHKGYERHYPRIHTNGDIRDLDLIDGHSVFWDPGYRRIASLLFASQVFIPKLS